jgi:subtilisin family serine protease
MPNRPYAVADALLARLIIKASDQGIAVVAAALQGEKGPGFPASLERVMAVLTSDIQGQTSFVTKVAHTPALAAPGVEILTTAPGRAYDYFSGSSLAAAHVSGIAALLLERLPTLPPTQMYALLQATARSASATGSASQTPVGVVDACAALEKLLGTPTCQ